ncbi:MAG: DbpA RNA binding domain-containing protein [Treponema sp.]|jgi:hypothetical protein|nr:DbpA RNA binding domain-containing protein [Treponema sp.]
MNEENVRKRIQQLLEEIQSKADPALLNQYRSIFRKEVSFFRRSYMAAYLLLLAEDAPASTGRGFRDFRKPRFEKTDHSPVRADRDEGPRYLPEDQSVRLFFSIGRNRKVFPREILGLILSRTDAKRDDIGMIRILDNYSFVQVRTEAAERIIAALNTQAFRGRTLTIDYARTRAEASETDEASTNADDGFSPESANDYAEPAAGSRDE